MGSSDKNNIERQQRDEGSVTRETYRQPRRLVLNPAPEAQPINETIPIRPRLPPLPGNTSLWRRLTSGQPFNTIDQGGLSLRAIWHVE